MIQYFRARRQMMQENNRLCYEAIMGSIPSLHILGGRAGIVIVQGYGPAAPWHSWICRRHARRRYRQAVRSRTIIRAGQR